MSYNVVTIPPFDKQLKRLVKKFPSLKTEFEVTSPKVYDPEFVAKIQKSKQEFEEGKFIHVEKDDLKQFLEMK